MPGFVSNILKLVSASLVSQVLGIVLIPILTRLYAPDDFGSLQIFMSLVSIVVIVSTFSYHFAIMLPKEDEDAAHIMALTVLLIVATSLVTVLVLYVLMGHLGGLLGASIPVSWLPLVPVVIFLNGMFLAMNYWLTRRGRFGTIAIARVANSLATRLTQIGAGLAVAATPLGLIAGLAGGYLLANAMMLRGLRGDLQLVRTASVGSMKRLAVRYREFPVFTTLATLANELSTQVTPFLLALYFDIATVGYYGLAIQVVYVPMGFVGVATAQVFFQRASQEHIRSGKVTDVVREVQRRLVSLGVLPMMLLALLAEDLFMLIFGPVWRIAGVYTMLLAPWFFLVFIAAPLSSLFNVLERQRIGLVFNLILLVSRLAVLSLGGMIGDTIVAIALYSVTGVVFWGWMILYLLNLSGIPYRAGTGVILNYLTKAFVVCLPAIAAKVLGLPLIVLFLAAGLAAAVYGAIILREDPAVRRALAALLHGGKAEG